MDAAWGDVSSPQWRTVKGQAPDTNAGSGKAGRALTRPGPVEHSVQNFPNDTTLLLQVIT